MASQNVYSVTLDEAIEAMRLTAADMSVKYKETSLSVSCAPICRYEAQLLTVSSYYRVLLYVTPSLLRPHV